MKRLDINVPGKPFCWETCGNCATSDLEVLEVLVRRGAHVDCFDTVVVLETNKTALEVPVFEAGRVVEVCVKVGDHVAEGDRLLRLECEGAR